MRNKPFKKLPKSLIFAQVENFSPHLVTLLTKYTHTDEGRRDV